MAERRKVPCRGIETICLVPTIEREDSYGWNNEKTRIGWITDGDYETMNIAEEYYLPRNLIAGDGVETEEEEHPYGIPTLFAQFAFIGAKNKKVDRYIPIEEIRYALNRGLAGKCNVNAVIDEYLAKEAAQSMIRMFETDMGNDEIRSACEQDPAEAINRMLSIKKEALQREFEEYDICDPEKRVCSVNEKNDRLPMPVVGCTKSLYSDQRQEKQSLMY